MTLRQTASDIEKCSATDAVSQQPIKHQYR